MRSKLFSLDPTLVARVPKTPVAHIEALAYEHYGLSVHAERLRAERDEIFKLKHGDGRLFILKLTSALEEPAATDLLTRALLHVERADPTLPTPRLISATDGRVAFRAPWGGESAPTVRLFSYLTGQPLYMAPRGLAQTAALGAMLARLGLALRAFGHAGDDRPLDWDISRAANAIPLLDAIEDASQRARVATYMTHFASNVEPRLRELRRQVIHNDLNPHNVLVDSASPERVVGVIDFGDIVRTALVNDVAIGASYLLQLGVSPLDYPLMFVAAYHAVSPLLPEELDLLYDLMAARLALTVAITEWRARRDPGNRAYITKNTGIAWDGIARLASLERERVAHLFRQTCNLERSSP
jgi:hydroxylysine kinase